MLVCRTADRMPITGSGRVAISVGSLTWPPRGESDVRRHCGRSSGLSGTVILHISCTCRAGVQRSRAGVREMCATALNQLRAYITCVRACAVPALQAGGRGFDSHRLHHQSPW